MEPCPISQMGADGKKHRDFMKWCKADKQVVMKGVEPARFQGKGIGMVATRDIKEGELILSVPRTALLIVAPDVPKSAYPGPISVHGRLAEALVQRISAEGSDSLAPWAAAMPSEEDIDTALPQAWPRSTHELFPTRIQDQLRESTAKMNRDTETYLKGLSPSSPDAERIFRWAWLLINSRCFYWDYPSSIIRKGARQPPKKKRDRNDCMALCPFVDYFNHTAAAPDDVQAEKRISWVSFSADGFEVHAGGDYPAGDELFVSYGAHHNDYLMVEYGFRMPDNAVDSVALDDYILKRLDSDTTQHLTDESLLGNYVCDMRGVCHRTQAALRAILLPWRKAVRFIKGIEDGEREQKKVDELLLQILRECQEDAEVKARNVSGIGGYPEEMLKGRWEEIGETAKHIGAMIAAEQR